MGLTRREFLKLASTGTAGAVLFIGCGVRPEETLVQSSIDIPEDLVTGLDTWYASLCRQCSSGEGIIVRVKAGRALKIEGNPDYPTNLGRTSARCQAGVQALYHPDRIKGPIKRVGERGSRQFQPISWDEAINEAAAKLKAQRSNPDGMVIITEPLRGHLAFLLQKFAQAYGGTHIAYEPLEDTVLRTAIKQVFGQDRLPDFDIANTNYMVSFGADFLGTWISPVRFARGYGEFRQGANRKRGVLVQVDPRFSMTAANADEWVPVKPGTEGVLALSMAYVIISQGLGETAAANALTNGRGAQYLQAYAPAQAEKITGIPAQRIEQLGHSFASQKPSLAIGGDSTAAHTNGLFNLTAIYSLNLLVGNVGKKGGIIFNPAPPYPQITAAANGAPFAEWQKLTNRIQTKQPKPVGLLLIRGANPVHGLPASLKFIDALKNVDTIISFSSFMDDTTAMADLVLPEPTYLEDWGDDAPEPGPGFQTVGFQQPVINPFLDTKGLADVLLTLAEEIGPDMKQALPWDTYRDLLRDGAKKLQALNRGSFRESNFEAFWNGLLQRGGWWDEQARATATAPTPSALPQEPVLPKSAGSEREFDFHLVPFASLSLADGRGAHLPWLQAVPDPITTATWRTWVEINARTAQQMGIREGEVLSIETPNGNIEALAYPNPATPPTLISIPIGQGHSAYGQYAEGRGANLFSVLAPLSDEKTGAFAWAATRARIHKTDRWIRLPKFEGAVLAVETEEGRIIQITKPM